MERNSLTNIVYEVEIEFKVGEIKLNNTDANLLPNGPSMNWHVPGTPEGVNVVRVPPVAVEITIGKV